MSTPAASSSAASASSSSVGFLKLSRSAGSTGSGGSLDGPKKRAAAASAAAPATGTAVTVPAGLFLAGGTGTVERAIVEVMGENPFTGMDCLPEVAVPVRPKVTARMPAEQQLRLLQGYVEAFEYNYLPTTFFNKCKYRPLQRILETAKEVMKIALPIRCLEATYLAISLTQGMLHLQRFPLTFKTSFNGQVCRHIVLAVRVVDDPAAAAAATAAAHTTDVPPAHLQSSSRRSSSSSSLDRARKPVARGRSAAAAAAASPSSDRWGALGLSRKRSLMYKRVEERTLASLVEDYADAYRELGHRVLNVKVGLPVSHTPNQSYVPSWRFLTVDYKSLPAHSREALLHSFVQMSPRLAAEWCKLPQAQMHAFIRSSKNRCHELLGAGGFAASAVAAAATAATPPSAAATASPASAPSEAEPEADEDAAAAAAAEEEDEEDDDDEESGNETRSEVVACIMAGRSPFRRNQYNTPGIAAVGTRARSRSSDDAAGAVAAAAAAATSATFGGTGSPRSPGVRRRRGDSSDGMPPPYSPTYGGP